MAYIKKQFSTYLLDSSLGAALVTLSRLIVKVYDNDGNSNMQTNGESMMLNYISENYKHIFDDSGLVFFDVGANIGKYTSILNDKFDSDKTCIYSFDPSPDNLSEIVNRFLSNVTVVQTAISNYNGKLIFTRT